MERELDLIKDSTPGNDGVRMAALKVVSDGVKDLVYKCIIDVLNWDPAGRNERRMAYTPA